MPYAFLDELPPAVRKLPRHAQEIFRSAFNSAWHSYPGEEEVAFRVAWAAVKKRHRKVAGLWVEKDESSGLR
jgi:cation transport regulator